MRCTAISVFVGADDTCPFCLGFVWIRSSLDTPPKTQITSRRAPYRASYRANSKSKNNAIFRPVYKGHHVISIWSRIDLRTTTVIGASDMWSTIYKLENNAKLPSTSTANQLQHTHRQCKPNEMTPNHCCI